MSSPLHKLTGFHLAVDRGSADCGGERSFITELAAFYKDRAVGNVLRLMRCSRGCGGRVLSAWLETGPLLNRRMRARRVPPLGPGGPRVSMAGDASFSGYDQAPLTVGRALVRWPAQIRRMTALCLPSDGRACRWPHLGSQMAMDRRILGRRPPPATHLRSATECPSEPSSPVWDAERWQDTHVRRTEAFRSQRTFHRAAVKRFTEALRRGKNWPNCLDFWPACTRQCTRWRRSWWDGC